MNPWEIINALVVGADALGRDNRQLRHELENILSLFEHLCPKKDDYSEAIQRAHMALGGRDGGH